MIIMITKGQLPIIVVVQVPHKNGKYRQLQRVIPHNVELINKHQLHKAKHGLQNIASNGTNTDSIVSEYSVQENVHDPDDVILSHVDGQQ
jgi:hypothetical protein